MAEPAMPVTSKPGKSRNSAFVSVRLCRRMMHRLMIATLDIIGDPLLHRQPAGDHVEFDPTFEGEAVDKLLI